MHFLLIIKNIFRTYLFMFIPFMLFPSWLFSQKKYPKVEWATYFGGTFSNEEFAGSLSLDSKGNAVFCGGMGIGAQTTSDVHQNSCGGGTDASVTKFDKNGNLIMSTYFGGIANDYSSVLAIDKDDNIIITGSTFSSSKIASTDAYQKTNGGNGDGFIAKLSSEGKLLWSSYFGGPSLDEPYRVATDALGYIYIVGITKSTTKISSDSTVHQFSYGGGVSDGFIAKFDPQGALSWSTYFGGAGADYANGVTIDKDGNIYVAGSTRSFTNIATPESFDDLYGGGLDAFVAKFSSDGKILVSTYFGAGSNDEFYTVIVDKNNDLLLAGPVSSKNLSTNATLHTGKQDVLLAKFDKFLNRQWATYVGGNEWDTCFGIATDKDNNPIISVMSQSFNFPVTENAFQKDFMKGIWDGAFVKFTSEGELMWSTYFGGTGNDRAIDIAVDEDGLMYGLSSTDSPDLATPNAYQTQHKGPDQFLLKMSEVLSVSTNDLEKIEKLSVYPNPTSEYISIPSFSKNTSAIIYRTDGTPIKIFHRLNTGKIDVRTLPQGQYFIVLTAESGKEKVGQFVKGL